MTDRRSFLAGAGAAGALALAGCLGTGAGNGSDGDDRTESDSGATTAASGDATGDGEGPLGGHPAARGIGEDPTLGPAVGETGDAIVAFEDPSCRTCRRFETETFPRIESDLVGEGVAFVYRVFPIVFEWGKPASQALEATYARDDDAFWALKDHYYAEQDAFDAGNVLDRTASFLSSETSVDADGVVADAEERAFDDRVRADVEAGEAAGVSATPTFYLFSGGEFETEVTGAKDYTVFAAALGY